MLKNISMLVIVVILSVSIKLTAQEYLRNLPDEKMRSMLTKENFPDMDAVIILDERSSKYEEVNIINYDRGGSDKTTEARELIVKLFNDKAVERYGKHSFTYLRAKDFYVDIQAKARVLKPDGTIQELTEKNIKIIKEASYYNDKIVKNKVQFMIPDLAAGDIVQFEYMYTDPLMFSSGVQHYFNNEDFTLFSNLYVTFPSRYELGYFCNPEAIVGPPVDKQLSDEFDAGKTYFWSLRNLRGIAGESYSPPFYNSMASAAVFIKNRWGKDDWTELGKNIYKYWIDPGSVSSSNRKKLGFENVNLDAGAKLSDSLYSAIKKYFRVEKENALYVDPDEIDEIFDSQKASASYMALIMYKILKKWDIPADIVLIRDKREGSYDVRVPMMEWFDRFGVSVVINGIRKYYDFDCSTIVKPETPWYLSGVTIPLIRENGVEFLNLPANSYPERNSYVESHQFRIERQKLMDSVNVILSGSAAQRLRESYYDEEEADISAMLKNRFEGHFFKSFTSISHNQLFEESKSKLTLAGESGASYDKIDTVAVINIKSLFITELLNRINTALRKNDYYFDTPFQMQCLAKIELPAGYELKWTNEESEIAGPEGTEFICSRSGGEKEVTFNAILKFNKNFIPVSAHTKLISFLQKCTAEINKSILLSTKKQ